MHTKLIPITLFLAAAGCAASEADVDTIDTTLPEESTEKVTIETTQGVRDVAVTPRDDGMYVFDGDIVVSEEELAAARVDEGRPGARAAVRPLGSRRWPTVEIPYELDHRIPDLGRVTRAIAHWGANTPFRFVPHTGQRDYIRFTESIGCTSRIGRVGGEQRIEVGRSCEQRDVIHDIGHALGFLHEHTRVDRDDFVTYHSECAQPGTDAHFSKDRDALISSPYDYQSIMHFDSVRFARPNCQTLLPRSNHVSIGTTEELSPGDIFATYEMVFGARPTWITLPGDYDNDGKTDFSLRDSIGVWRIDYSRDGYGEWNVEVAGYGGGDAHPVPADYDADGKLDLSVKTDGGVWFVDYAIDGFGAWNDSIGGYGWGNTIPVAAHFDTDRKADRAVYRVTDGAWFVDKTESGPGWDIILAGTPTIGAVPMVLDFDGNGVVDLSVKDASGAWRIDFGENDFASHEHGYELTLEGFGGADSIPVPGHYLPNRRELDLAVKNSDNQWRIFVGLSTFGPIVYEGYGGADAVPTPGDYDADGLVDLSVRATTGSGNWFIDHSGDGFGRWNDWFAQGF